MISGAATIALLVCALLMIIGGLVGHSVSQHLLRGEIRRQAAVRRELGEQWRSIQKLRSDRSRYRCARCGARTDDWYVPGEAA